MKNVNLLPKWYRMQRRERRTLRGHIVLMILLAGITAGAWVVARNRVAALVRERDGLTQQLSRIRDVQPELLREQDKLRHLEDLQIAYRELGKTIPMSSVIQQIQNDMTPGMALSRVLIEIRPDPIKGSGMVGDLRSPPRYHDVAYLTVEGIAPMARQTMQLIEKLSDNPLFSEVTLDYTKNGTLNTFLVTRFELKMKMDLERLTMQDPDLAGPVANGAPSNAQ